MMTEKPRSASTVLMWYLKRPFLVFIQELEKYVCWKCSDETRYIFSACTRPPQDPAILVQAMVDSIMTQARLC